MFLSGPKMSGSQIWLFWWKNFLTIHAVELADIALLSTYTYGSCKADFSKETAEVVTTDLRESTVCLYQGKWSKFLHWCHRRNIAPCKATVQQVAEFFLYLQKEVRLLLPAVKGYRVTFNLVFTRAGMDLATNRVISKMCSSFKKSCLSRG